MAARSLTQTREVLEFKGTKTEEPRAVTLPLSAIALLNAHRSVLCAAWLGESRCPSRALADLPNNRPEYAERGRCATISA